MAPSCYLRPPFEALSGCLRAALPLSHTLCLHYSPAFPLCASWAAIAPSAAVPSHLPFPSHLGQHCPDRALEGEGLRAGPSSSGGLGMGWGACLVREVRLKGKCRLSVVNLENNEV